MGRLYFNFNFNFNRISTERRGRRFHNLESPPSLWRPALQRRDTEDGVRVGRTHYTVPGRPSLDVHVRAH